MSDLKTLHKVVDIAERRRDDARAALAQQQRELQIAHEQLQQLQTYAQEAHQRWAARSSSIGVDAQQLFHQRQFMDKIDHAIEFQRGVIANREALIERAEQQVVSAERDVAGLRKYTERKLLAVQQQAARQEQKATDEMALNLHLRQSLARAQGLRP